MARTKSPENYGIYPFPIWSAYAAGIVKRSNECVVPSAARALISAQAEIPIASTDIAITPIILYDTIVKPTEKRMSNFHERVVIDTHWQ